MVARVWSLAQVEVEVVLEVKLTGELLLTQCTLVWPFAGMGQLVTG